MIKRQAKLLVITRPDLESFVNNDVRVHAYTELKAKQVRFYAWKRFISMVKHTHPVTPPPYADSFFIRSYRRNGVVVYQVGNDDPVALLVEFGAHPRGGPTEVLGYRPLGHGVDAAGGHG